MNKPYTVSIVFLSGESDLFQVWSPYDIYARPGMVYIGVYDKPLEDEDRILLEALYVFEPLLTVRVYQNPKYA